MIEEQRDQPVVRIYRRRRQRREAELAAGLGIGAALEQEACSVEPTVRAGNVQQGLTAPLFPAAFATLLSAQALSLRGAATVTSRSP